MELFKIKETIKGKHWGMAVTILRYDEPYPPVHHWWPQQVFNDLYDRYKRGRGSYVNVRYTMADSVIVQVVKFFARHGFSEVLITTGSNHCSATWWHPTREFQRPEKDLSWLD